MALKATIHKLELSVADMDRGYYGTHAITIARHPSETSLRMMIRVAAFAAFAEETLEFGRGISAEDEPALWTRDLTGNILHWIELGLPDDRLLRRAAGRSARLTLVAYGGRAVDVWWAQNRADLARVKNLTVVEVPFEANDGLEKLADKYMKISATIQDGEIMLSDGKTTVSLKLIIKSE